MYETVIDVITLGVIVAGITACALHKRSVSRQVDALRAEVAVARIEGVLGQEPHAEGMPVIPAPAHGKS